MELRAVTDGEDRPVTILDTDQGTRFIEHADGKITIIRLSNESPSMELKSKAGKLHIILNAPKGD